jgi:hypothetical protein
MNNKPIGGVPVDPTGIYEGIYKDRWLLPPTHSARYRGIGQFADIAIRRVIPSVMPEGFHDAISRINWSV